MIGGGRQSAPFGASRPHLPGKQIQTSIKNADEYPFGLLIDIFDFLPLLRGHGQIDNLGYFKAISRAVVVDTAIKRSVVLFLEIDFGLLTVF